MEFTVRLATGEPFFGAAGFFGEGAFEMIRERTQEEFGGTWSIAQYMAAQEMKPGAKRDAIVAEILKYNEEDLAATWAVLDWLRGL